MSEVPDEVIGEAHEASRYFWFQGESVVDLVQAINEYGGPTVARVEVHEHGNKAYFHVKYAAGENGDIVNNSHVHPPE